jgi:CubicO group peptidase (beta-lactamase class C family)
LEIRMRAWRWVALPLLCASGAFLAPAAALPKAKPADAGLDAAWLEAVAPRMREFVAARKIAGAVTLVARRGKVAHLEAVGDADIENHRPMRTDSIFWLASQAKPTTAVAVMVLVDEGKVELDAPVSRYLPVFAKQRLRIGPPMQEMTVRQLMSHTAGLAQPFRDPNDGVYTLRRYAESLVNRPLEFEPGSAYEYGYGLTVAGAVVEAVSGRLFEEFLQERVFGPLGMKDTTFNPTAKQWPRLTKTYKPGPDGSLQPAYNPFIAQDATVKRFPEPSGGLFSTAPDMARFYQMMLNGGELEGRRIVSSRAVETMTTPQTAGGKPITYALGWQTFTLPAVTPGAAPIPAYGHGGAFGTDGFVIPSRQVVGVMMIQRTQFPNGGEIAAAFRRLVVEAAGD